ncbi:MAG: hypothetical protein RIR51_875 [Bacteroidota bacterium]|jgi:UDP-N-acetylglucosamine diphosphorylase/glucosamine-1-phosphate N-acetyltransferase
MLFYTDPKNKENLHPLSDHISIENFLIGTSTIAEKWQAFLSEISNPFFENNTLRIASNFLPNEELLQVLKNLDEFAIIYSGDAPIAWVQKEKEITKKIVLKTPSFSINHPEDLLKFLEEYLIKELNGLASSTKGFEKENQLFNPSAIHIHPSVRMQGAILDASEGPIHIGENSKISIGTLIKGPVFLGKEVYTNLGTKIRPFTTIGDGCAIGGEVSFSIFHPQSNKSHDGFMGHSIIGSYCNFGAGTNVSNLKNTVGSIQIQSKKNRDSGRFKLGIITGSFVATGIGIQINSGVCLGNHINVYGSNLIKNYIPNFSWGEPNDLKEYTLDRCIIHVKNWLKLRNQKSDKILENRIEDLWTNKTKFRN